MTALSISTDIARQHPQASRKELIGLFVEAGVSYGAAGTYASTLRQKFINESESRAMQEARPLETDAEIRTRLDDRFETIDMLAHASTRGQIRSLIIGGPAGLGKSFTIEAAVGEYDPDRTKSIIAKGFVKATGLYLLLHEYQRKGNIIVFDDCDSIFRDEDALNILKSALDTTKERRISWRSETKMTDVDGEPIPREFEFNGTVIFITNVDFDEMVAKGGKGSEHYEALISRSHYIECDMNAPRDYVIRIEQVCERGMLTDQKGLTQADSDFIVQYIKEHQDSLRELTLRMALKLADLLLLGRSNFHKMAKVACHKRRA